MNFFRKTANTSLPAAETAPQEVRGNTTPPPVTGRTAEELARGWWNEKYGEPMPEEMVTWMKRLTRAEARRLGIAQALLTPQQKERIEDARRLAETKLKNIEASLQRIHDQQEWVHRFDERKHELTEHKGRLYEVNKRLAASAQDEKELGRFEAFESIQGVFQRMQVLERMAHANRQSQSALARDMEELSKQTGDQQKRLQQMSDDRREATNLMMSVRDRLEVANRITGERTILDLDERALEEVLETIGQQRLILGKETDEREAEVACLQELVTQQTSTRQSMEPHQSLMEHGEMVLTLLGRLYEMRQELEAHTNEQNGHLRHQQEENDMLNRLFSEFQGVESEIKVLNDELRLHRQQNLGRSSYSLQERAMEQKSRRQMLISAQSLWNRIQSGYNLIEEKTQTVNRLRLSIDNLKQNIENLEEKVVPMRQLCHEKEYTLTLSKSQNVIQLRGDLKEGVGCTVCGAKHHPYHSDTMLEQSKLISDLRTDYELLQAELIGKEEQLQQLKLELAAETARRDVEESVLSLLRQRQMEDVREWGVFASLDRTFQECSPSTNQEARTALLRQLIENAVRDADAAQTELDEYNFHQTRINEISETLTRKEQHKNDLTLRLNEVNTGCQVVARQVEQGRQRHTELHERYTHLYEKLGKMITLADWYQEWQNSHEALLMRIERMMESWNRLNEEIEQMKLKQQTLQAELEEKRSTCAFLDQLTLQVRDFREQRRTLRKEGEKTYESLLGQMEVKEFFDSNFQSLQQTKQLEEEQREETQKARETLAEMRGRQQELVEQCQGLDADSIAERSRLDVWMRQFNANNPPVQYVELERAFATGKDWNETREHIRGMRIEAMLEQARVDALRSAIVALQAEGMRPTNNDDTDEVLEKLVAQQKQLEKQRLDVLMQLAEQRIALNSHEECTARLKAEEEELYAMTNT